MRTAVIGLVGYARSGKDTAAAGLIADGWQRVSFADGVRELALAINPIIDAEFDDESYRLGRVVERHGWEAAKECEEVRGVLQRIGTGVRNIVGESAWVDIAADKAEEHLDFGQNVVFSDVRFPNEIEMIHRRLCGVIVRITRPGVGPVNGHISETALDDFEADYTIVNDGTEEELQAKLVAIAASLEAKAAA